MAFVQFSARETKERGHYIVAKYTTGVNHSSELKRRDHCIVANTHLLLEIFVSSLDSRYLAKTLCLQVLQKVVTMSC